MAVADKVTIMVIKVDLQCYRCCKKIKKVLSKFREIRDQVFDEKQNKVTITVITCCPGVILEKIKRKGGKSVESIEIVPEKKKEGEKKKDDGKTKEPEKKKDSGDKDKPKDSDKKKDSGDKEKEKPKDGEKKKESTDIKKMEVEPVSGFPTIYPSGAMIYPAAPGGYYQPYYGGYVGGPGPAPYYHGPARQCMCFDCRNNPNRFDYFSEENASACTIM